MADLGSIGMMVFGAWGAGAQSIAWSDGIVVSPPLFDDDLRLLQAVEGLPIHQFIPEAGVEGIAVADLPGRAGFNVSGFGTNSCNPVTNSRRYGLRTII